MFKVWGFSRVVKKVKCPQLKCAYIMGGGCKNCKQCDCEPNMINENCDICYNCSKDEGILRWDNQDENTEEQKDTETIQEEIKVKEKPIEVKA